MVGKVRGEVKEGRRRIFNWWSRTRVLSTLFLQSSAYSYEYSHVSIFHSLRRLLGHLVPHTPYFSKLHALISTALTATSVYNDLLFHRTSELH